MSDEATATTDTDASDAPADALSMKTYFKLTVLNRVSLLGVLIAVAGGAFIFLTSPTGLFPGGDPLFGGMLLLSGAVVFAFGFSLGQRALKRRGDW